MPRTVHIQLGRNGDLILLLPCWQQIFQTTGERPVVVTSHAFGGVLSGVSYVQSDLLNVHWYGGIPAARQVALFKYGHYEITQCHGFGKGVDLGAWPTFGETMWAVAGFPGQYGTLPLVFDRRDPVREARLVDRVKRAFVRSWSRPIVLYNFKGDSSPLPAAPDVARRLYRRTREFCLVDLGMVRGQQIYDLLGLFDVAAGLITIDTSTLHLAAASAVPTLAFLRGGWNSAIAKPGAMTVPYAEAHQRLEVVDEFLDSLKLQPVPA